MKPSRCVTVCVVMAMVSGVGYAQNVVFSLDDLPVAPLTSPFYAGSVGLGAESPFGWAFGPLPLAPSPSLPAIVGPAVDGDILSSGIPAGSTVPVMHVPYQGPAYLDAVSSNKTLVCNPHLVFSVDRIAIGLAGTAVSTEAMNNQQPGDIYRTNLTWQYPPAFAGMLPAGGGYIGMLGIGPGVDTNHLLLDESQLTLTAGLGPGNMIPPGCTRTADCQGVPRQRRRL